MTVTGGAATQRSKRCGGGIYNSGTLTLNNCAVRSDSAAPGPPGTPGGGISFRLPGSPGGPGGSGGGIFNPGTLNLSACSIVKNFGGPGGAGGSSSGFSVPEPRVGRWIRRRTRQLWNRNFFGCTFNGNSDRARGAGGATRSVHRSSRLSSRVQRPGDRADRAERFTIQAI